MSLAKMQTHLVDYRDQNANCSVDDLLKVMDAYVQEERTQYKKNLQDGKITFGKYKNFSVKELSGLEKGLDYLRWLLKQQWFTEDKFESLYASIRKDTSLLPKKKTQKKH